MNVYKNDLDETVRFRIEPHIGAEGIYLELQENGKRATTVFPPKDAPALALAVLEAAGVEASFDPDATYGTAEQLGHIQDHLHEYVKAKGRATAEAKEQAELEAEALELCDSARLANGRFKIGNFGLMKDAEKTTWLAVARRAREMRAEK